MSFLTSAISNLFKLSLFLLLIAVIPGLPPHAEFETYRFDNDVSTRKNVAKYVSVAHNNMHGILTSFNFLEYALITSSWDGNFSVTDESGGCSIPPSVPLNGALAVNSRLNGAERLFEDVIHGPEDLQVYDGAIFTTLHGGHVVKIVQDKIHPIAKFGQKCDGFHEEDRCGRPLGLAIDKKGQMFVADAYYGIFQVDLKTGKSKNLVSVNDTIEGKQPRIPNSVAVDDSGVVYWTDSSTTHSLHDGLYTALVNGNGRLLKYDLASKTNKVLLDKLHFANGVAVSEDGGFLVVCETFNYRVVKYHLKGPKAGESEVFVDRLPGTPDNIHTDGRGGFVVSLILPRGVESPSAVERLAPYPLVRKLLARLMYLGQRAVTLLRDLYPHDLLKRAAHLIGHFESLPAPSIKRATVLFLTKEGKISRSLHATDGLTGISDFVEFGGYYYLGSPFNTFLARVKAN